VTTKDGVDLDAAFAAIDAVNADDPNTLFVRGELGPKEQAHAEMAVEWIRRLVAEPSDALLLAARSHHVRRWEIRRDSEPEGRNGYLVWRRKLEQHHAAVAADALAGAGVDPTTIARVSDIIRKRRIKSDAEVQVFEDALCLVFIETQFADLAARLDEDHMVEVTAKTLQKMTHAGRELALTLPLDPDAVRIVEKALALPV
jgi:Domain of unknown function (DUF4202)